MSACRRQIALRQRTDLFALTTCDYLNFVPDQMGTTRELMNLWVKAGSDGASLGGDPVSQQLFMVLLLKAESGKCRFNVRTLNEAKLPTEFRQVNWPISLESCKVTKNPSM